MIEWVRRAAALICIVLGASIAGLSAAQAKTGADLWLQYDPLPRDVRQRDMPMLRGAVALGDDPTLRIAAQELNDATRGMLATQPSLDGPGVGAVLLGTPESSPVIAAMKLDLSDLGQEGYRIRSLTYRGKPVTVIAANAPAGVLYGAFALIRRIQTGQMLNHLDIADAPKLQVRVLDHWDNLDRSVERGYAGRSIWNWWTLPDYVSPRIADYGRADASIGINGVVLNNVNASALSLTPRYIAKAAAIADTLRPWHVRVYLSARFSAPIELGGLKTADPLDPGVQKWWADKADEIYKAIPDFGGFLIKANSEGQPGPGDYHRTHAQGANMLAAALKPHGGIVMWRAFVYSSRQGADRAAQAYDEFTPLDGAFADNVLVQVKNGPIDFQPREPFSPLFGAMPKTPLMLELQVTKEYLGQGTHLVYLGPLFAETLDADTQADGPGTTVAKVIEGRMGDPKHLTGIAGVANVGTDIDWTGSIFNQANWYAFGRLAWNPQADPKQIAAEWTKLTFGSDPRIVQPIVDMMTTSREAVVNYMTPLGLAHQMATGSHYGPGPWVSNLSRPEWNPVYYNQANKNGIGFDRTKTGSDEVAQYAPPVAKAFADLATVPDRDLLWFHHVAWDYRLHSGKTLWTSLLDHYQTGVEQVKQMQATWQGLKGRIDHQRWAKTDAYLDIQLREAKWWRDASVLYWASVSGQAVPASYPKPAHDLAYYEALHFPNAPGH